MTDQRQSHDPAAGEEAAPPPEADAPAQPVTGVASGGLGTAANLEETQVIRTEDLQAFQAREAEHRIESLAAEPKAPAEPPPPMVEPPAGSTFPPPQIAPPRAPLAPAPVQPVANTRPTRATGAARTTRATRDRRPRLPAVAGVLAVALVVLAGMAILTTRDDGVAGTGGAPPVADSTPTAAPATDKPDAGVGGEKGNKGKGKGNGGGGRHD